MITTSSPSYHNVFCPTAGTYSSYYFDALRANSRRSNKKVSLVKNTLSRAQLQQQERQQQHQQQQKSLMENNQHLLSLSKKMNSKKKSVRFSDKSDQVRLFYQWETPQQADQLNDNVPHFHHEQQQKHQVTPKKTMVSTTAKVTTLITDDNRNKNQQQQSYQLVLINNKKEQGSVTVLKKEHQLLSTQVPLKLNSVHIVHNVQRKNSSLAPTIVGTCHVANFAFEKHVMVRYTFDNWSKSTDINAIYCESMAGSTIDRFTFEFQWENDYFDSSLQFALRYSVNDTEFWDNNNGNNYCARLITQQQDKNKDGSENFDCQQEHKGELNDNSKMLTSTNTPWISSSTLHQKKSNLFNATSINPWTTSSFWTLHFPSTNSSNSNNSIPSSSSMLLQQF
ncbi:hypothetical protein INT45_010484 [Circinella minor]|uniref:CBM21 domain-containing protein n=1 Tax=Circinella minor TaxID=1195481 RepID=A0A8H7VIN3_9FUNG|nr:hypothetical protein INT45_010484 [Circinella minor]